VKRIESDFVSPRSVPKFFVHGSYGSGKTHTLLHIQDKLKRERMYPTEPIYIDIAPWSQRSVFERVHASSA
jgi:nucleoside-triphosphatase THEP1